MNKQIMSNKSLKAYPLCGISLVYLLLFAYNLLKGQEFSNDNPLIITNGNSHVYTQKNIENNNLTNHTENKGNIYIAKGVHIVSLDEFKNAKFHREANHSKRSHKLKRIAVKSIAKKDKRPKTDHNKDNHFTITPFRGEKAFCVPATINNSAILTTNYGNSKSGNIAEIFKINFPSFGKGTFISFSNYKSTLLKAQNTAHSCRPP